MYKQENKEKFLNQFENEKTKKVYETIFVKSEKIESKLNLDIMNFNLEQLKMFIEDYIKPKTKESARTYCNILSSYIQWSVSNGLSINNENPLNISQEYFSKFAKNQNSLYFSKDELDMMLFSLVNAQDGIIIKALFEGVQGKKLSELLNLKISDIENATNSDNMLKLEDFDGSIRNIKVSSELLKLAKIANKEDRYYKKNGEVDLSYNVKETASLEDTDYILKPTITNNNLNKRLTYYSVYNRIEMIRSLEDFEDYKDSLTTKNIVRSGMLYEAYKIYTEKKSLEKSDIEEICKKYNLNYKWSLRDFLNENTIKEVYNI